MSLCVPSSTIATCKPWQLHCFPRLILFFLLGGEPCESSFSWLLILANGKTGNEQRAVSHVHYALKQAFSAQCKILLLTFLKLKTHYCYCCIPKH